MNGRTVLITQLPESEEVAMRAAAAAPGFRIVFQPEPSPEVLSGAEVVAGHLRPDQIVLAKALRWNHLWTAGADADLSPEMVASDVVLTSSAGNGAIPLAEHAMMLLLMINRRASRWIEAQAGSRWDSFRHGELAGKTVGIIGMGNAGKDLALKCRAFHMRVLGVRSRPDLCEPSVERMFAPEQLAKFAAECDYVVVTAPLTPATREMVGPEVFAAMGRDAAIINVSRGEIIDHDALLEAITSGKIAAAGLDAHRDEPLPADAPWWNLPNVIVTPHNGATTPQTLERGIEIFIGNLERYAKDGALANIVNKHSGYALQ